MCSARKLRELLKQYLRLCQPICPLALCDLQELCDLLLHGILEKSTKKAGNRPFEPMHIILAVEELFPNHESLLGDFVKSKRKREKLRLLRRRRRKPDRGDAAEDSGGSSD